MKKLKRFSRILWIFGLFGVIALSVSHKKSQAETNSMMRTSAPISSVTVTISNPSPSQLCVLTMTGAPGGKARIESESNKEEVPMNEVSSGMYVGTYQFRSQDKGKDSTLILKLDSPPPAGNSNTDLQNLASSISPPTQGDLMYLNVLTPHAAAIVPEAFEVSGKTEPSALVRLRVVGDNGAWIGYKKEETFSGQALADSDGSYHFCVGSGNLPPTNSHLAMEVQSEDAQGKRSKTVHMELTQRAKFPPIVQTVYVHDKDKK